MKLASPIKLKRSRIEIIPLIDIMFFLLAAFMMVSLRMDRTGNIFVQLPAASQSLPDYQPDMLHIAVDADGNFWLEKQQVEAENLATVLAARLEKEKDAPLFISGDYNVRHEHVAAVLRTARAAGIQKVSFLVRDQKEIVP